MRSSESVSPWAGERAGERARLEAAISGARDGRGAIVVLDGPPGIGKSALVDVGAQFATAQGLAVARACAHELEAALPYAVVRTLFETFAAGALEGEAARVLGHGDGESTDPEAPARVVYGLYELVAGLVGDGPLPRTRSVPRARSPRHPGARRARRPARR